MTDYKSMTVNELVYAASQGAGPLVRSRIINELESRITSKKSCSHDWEIVFIELGYSRVCTLCGKKKKVRI